MSASMGSLDRIHTLAPPAPAALPAREVRDVPGVELGRQFQIDVLGLMTKSYHFLLCATEILAPENFEDDVLAFFFRAIRDSFLKQHAKPTSQALWLAMTRATHAGRIKHEDLCGYVDVFCQLKNPKAATEFDIDDVVAFCLKPAPRRARKRA